MIKSILLIALVFVAVVLAQQRPNNYFAAQKSARGQQAQVQNFAAWNFTTGSWVEVLPPIVSGGAATINNIVTIGNGLLAVGDFQQIAGKPAAGLAYYDGATWCAPEGVGLFLYTPDPTTTAFNNSLGVVTPGSAFAATVVNNTDVYILGYFNQVGLQRGGVAGMVKLTWSQGGVFTIGTIGTLGYNEQQSTTVPCNNCPRATQPGIGDRRKLASYQKGNQLYFVYHDNAFPNPGNLYLWAVDSPNWVNITQQNNARNLSTAIKDFDIFGGIIFVVGNFYNDKDPDVNNRYVHIACSPDEGSTWKFVSNLPLANFGNLIKAYDPTTNIAVPALTGTGLTSIVVQSATTIFVAGGWRVTERNISVDNLAGQLQTRVMSLTVGGTYTLISERFAGDTYGAFPNYNGPSIYKLAFYANALYAFGDFTAYRQVVPFQGSRFGVRYTDVYKGAARFANNTWSPAFGGFITQTFAGDDSPPNGQLFFAYNGADAICFSGSFQSTWGILSGGVFGYGGDTNTPLKRGRWNSVLQNQRFTSAVNYNDGIGKDGDIFSLHMTKSGDALIIGGQFDWIGSQRIGGIAAYNPNKDQVQPIGGGLYLYNSVGNYGGDNFYNNRRGGCVFDIEEWNGWLIAAGTFNRNNSGSCVSNIARNKFRTNNAGWFDIDGGCDNQIRDVLVVGNTLYATGDFGWCGTRQVGYNGGQVRGRVPINRIAQIDLGDNNGRWRYLGIGLQGGNGYAMAWRGGDLFVGGDFTTAGGVINTGGIARWRGDKWDNVVARCRNGCGDRPPQVIPYQGGNGNSGFPIANTRKPAGCKALKSFNGLVFCADTTTNQLAYFTSDTWQQGGNLQILTSTAFQNSLFARNHSKSSYLIVPQSATAGADGANYYTFDHDRQQYTPSYGGFSAVPAALSSSNIVTFSTMIVATIILIFV